MDRRRFLRAGLCAGLAPLAGRLYAAPAAQSRFLLVFLRGGYDAASLLVPYASGFYYESRPTLAIRREEALPLDAAWGLHPALRESLLPLWEKGEAAFVPFAGTEDLSRSHFETQDSVELGQPQGGRKSYQSGFLNRLVSVLGGGAPIAFSDQLPVVFRGEARVANASLRFAGRSAVDARQSELIASMYRDSALGGEVQEGFATRERMAQDLAGEMEAASRNAINARGFAAQARRIARLMSASYNVGFVDVGGWDTHAGEGAATGQLAARLGDLGNGLAALAAEMGEAWRGTTVVVISEFGRTFRENGTRGTDHGHGTVYWVLGGAVRGRRIAGEQVALRPGALFQDRDYPVLNEYRALLGGLFRRQFGLSDGALAKVFPAAVPLDLGLV